MKPRYYLVTFFTILTIIIGVFKFSNFRNTSSFLSHISNILNDNNNIKVVCKNINNQKLTIKWISEQSGDKLIFSDGKQSGRINNEYGKNGFIIYYKDKEICNCGHFKTNDWHTHDYYFSLQNNHDTILLEFEASGPDYEFNKTNWINGKKISN